MRKRRARWELVKISSFGDWLRNPKLKILVKPLKGFSSPNSLDLNFRTALPTMKLNKWGLADRVDETRYWRTRPRTKRSSEERQSLAILCQRAHNWPAVAMRKSF